MKNKNKILWPTLSLGKWYMNYGDGKSRIIKSEMRRNMREKTVDILLSSLMTRQVLFARSLPFYFQDNSEVK